MPKPRRIYLLSPKNLTPETIAVAFAKTSRSPQAFDEIAAELSDEKAAKFHEKWVVGYGHSSVAEHAVLHLALENVSRLAIETIEGNRLASYTEKSTRYQLWEEDAFYLPQELENHPLKDQYVKTCKALFRAYIECLPMVIDALRVSSPRDEGESDRLYERRIQSEAVDICRFLLPAASLANVGVTINARALEYAICKMLSSSLEEVRAIGERLREVGKQEAPTLIKYADCNPYLVNMRKMLYSRPPIQPRTESPDGFSLIDWDEDGQEKILAALLYRFDPTTDYRSSLAYVKGLSPHNVAKLVQDIMSDRGKFTQPPREFEYAKMTFDIVMDQGAYFEFKRHRMMTQTAQPLTASLGFALPRGFTAAGCEDDYIRVMRGAADLYHELASWNLDAASYIVPNGFNRRVLFTLNLRQAFHFCRLRAADTAHFSIRRVAQFVARSIKKIYPLLGSFLDVPDYETPESISERNYSTLAYGEK
jgi:thymidylate synthase ThyX